MRNIGTTFLALMLGACAAAAITDRYGNQYGGWYNPGENFRWQLEACDAELGRQEIAPDRRKLAMRCCMWTKGVPINDPQDCVA